MAIILINPGTEARSDATEAHAVTVADAILMDFDKIEAPMSYERKPADDFDGWFRFIFRYRGKSVDVDIPGDDPKTVMEGTPFKSRRLYVDGSSWLFGFALGRIAETLGIGQ